MAARAHVTHMSSFIKLLKISSKGLLSPDRCQPCISICPVVSPLFISRALKASCLIYNAVFMSTRRMRVSSVPPAPPLGLGTQRDLASFLQLPRLPLLNCQSSPPLTTVTTVPTPPVPPSSSSLPLTWEAGAITTGVQSQASESSVSLPSTPVADSITSGKSGRSHSHLSTTWSDSLL